jgi:hypothetical protein
MPAIRIAVHPRLGNILRSDAALRGVVVTFTATLWDPVDPSEKEFGFALHEAPTGAPVQLTVMLEIATVEAALRL